MFNKAKGAEDNTIMAEIKTSVYRKLIKAGYSEEYAKYFDKVAFTLITMPDSDMRETMNIIAKQLNAKIDFDDAC